MAGDANFALDVANQLAAIAVEKRPGVRERIITELLTQPDRGSAQAVQGRTAGAELGEQPRLDELPPGQFLIAGTFDSNHRRVVHPATVVTVDPAACRARWQREQPVDVRKAVDAVIEQRDRHR